MLTPNVAVVIVPAVIVAVVEVNVVIVAVELVVEPPDKPTVTSAIALNTMFPPECPLTPNKSMVS